MIDSRRQARLLSALAPIAVLSFISTVLLLHSSGPTSVDSNLASTPPRRSPIITAPPLGFNGWNAYHCAVSERLIEQSASAMVSSGMKAAGYLYVNIDDCWSASTRDANGDLRANPVTFPRGIPYVAKYVHTLGLKLGIYAGAGTATCKGLPGSYGFENRDARTFAAWGVDYLKYDWCDIPFGDFPGLSHAEIARVLFTRMGSALRTTGRPIVYSMSNGGDKTLPLWTWGANVGDLWRTTEDISATWPGVLSIVDENVPHSNSSGPGHWNDPDMLEVGNAGLTPGEQQAHFSLWSMMAAPLIAGTDLRHMSSSTRRILTNREVIAIDQDPLGAGAAVVLRRGPREILVKRLANGDQAVLLLNRGHVAERFALSPQILQVKSTKVLIRNLWTHAKWTGTSHVNENVPASSAVLLRFASHSK